MISPLDSGSFYGEQEVYSDSDWIFCQTYFSLHPSYQIFRFKYSVSYHPPKLSYLDHKGSFGVDLCQLDIFYENDLIGISMLT